MKNSSHPILSIRQASISFAKKVLFEDLHINLFAQDRICLIGKNGVGKTTLMNAIMGKIDFDHGERWIMPGTTVGYLSQNEKLPPNMTVFDFIMSGLELDEDKAYLVDIVCDRLKIDKEAITHTLSGGQQRRANLARALIIEPKILLLDEPTNHLDLEIIQWLEEYLQGYQGVLLVISHDRKFLEKVSNKIYWLRAGTMIVNNHGYKNFDEWSNGIIEHEQRKLDNLEKKVQLESGWLQTGVTARRKRNIGRLHYLGELRQKLAAQRKLVKANQGYGQMKSEKDESDAPQLIMSLKNVSKSWEDKKIFDKFSLKILRGEKIGIIGKNGCGKSTLLKMMIGEIEPDSGTLKPAHDIALSYFDQARSTIKPDSSLQEILCGPSSDHVHLPNGKSTHVCGYLKNFLFDPKDAKTLAGTLSGGQQNRLLLAKTLANPGNFMILDEPTNDLDMDSLDMLQEYLAKYEGTLIVVSHDRDFLDNVVTSVLAFEGDAKVTTHLGGYSDYIEYQNKYVLEEAAKKKKEKEKKAEPKKENTPSKNLSYKNRLELEKIPAKIEKLEAAILILSTEINETEDRSAGNIAHISIEIAKFQKELDKVENRWLELESLQE